VRVEVATEDEGIRPGGRPGGAEIREKLGVVATVEALARDTMPRAGYKAKRVLDRH
jgi:hypothetical protein